MFTIDRPNITILDVGHGTAVVLSDVRGTVVVDGGQGGTLLDFLTEAGIDTVDVLLISHADTDHYTDACNLLLSKDIGVGAVYYNTDTSKRSKWRMFQSAIEHARREKDTVAHSELTISQDPVSLSCGSVEVKVLFPPPEQAGVGPGGVGTDEAKITSNSMSAVIRLKKSDGCSVLLAGDIDNACFDFWGQEGTDPDADVLVFPHHGGSPSGHDSITFAETICEKIRPECVIFSMGRGQHGKNPRPEVVDAIRRKLPQSRILCTQLSENCIEELPEHTSPHLLDAQAKGRRDGCCCAGTIVVDLSGPRAEVKPGVDDHKGFIEGVLPDAMCTHTPEE